MKGMQTDDSLAVDQTVFFLAQKRHSGALKTEYYWYSSIKNAEMLRPHPKRDLDEFPGKNTMDAFHVRRAEGEMLCIMASMGSPRVVMLTRKYCKLSKAICQSFHLYPPKNYYSYVQQSCCHACS